MKALKRQWLFLAGFVSGLSLIALMGTGAPQGGSDDSRTSRSGEGEYEARGRHATTTETGVEEMQDRTMSLRVDSGFSATSGTVGRPSQRPFARSALITVAERGALRKEMASVKSQGHQAGEVQLVAVEDGKTYGVVTALPGWRIIRNNDGTFQINIRIRIGEEDLASLVEQAGILIGDNTVAFPVKESGYFSERRGEQVFYTGRLGHLFGLPGHVIAVGLPGHVIAE